jgi:hypothetical protein
MIKAGLLYSRLPNAKKPMIAATIAAKNTMASEEVHTTERLPCPESSCQDFVREHSESSIASFSWAYFPRPS